VLAALAVVIVLVIVLVVAKPFSGNPSQPVTNNLTPTADPNPPQTTASTNHADSLAALLGDDDAQLEGLSADQMTTITDLAINEGLPSEWMNILLLGSDERKLSDSARTDSMIICSINTATGEVKLTSIMRDLAVYMDEIGEYAGTYRINAANYFGGEELAMRTVNECFGLNIQHYVRVNFYGFQQVAEMMGGIEMDISEEEMHLINELIVQQAVYAYYNGVDESALQNQFLETYGPNTHLDGRQTLAYARIRKLSGGDYARAERQRNVLEALMKRLQGAGPAELLAIGTTALPHISTNLSFNEILSVATTVTQNGVSGLESFRLPINNSYVQETRNEESMFYDCDWAANTAALYNFIYE